MLVVQSYIASFALIAASSLAISLLCLYTEGAVSGLLLNFSSLRSSTISSVGSSSICSVMTRGNRSCVIPFGGGIYDTRQSFLGFEVTMTESDADRVRFSTRKGATFLCSARAVAIFVVVSGKGITPGSNQHNSQRKIPRSSYFCKGGLVLSGVSGISPEYNENTLSNELLADDSSARLASLSESARFRVF